MQQTFIPSHASLKYPAAALALRSANSSSLCKAKIASRRMQVL